MPVTSTGDRAKTENKYYESVMSCIHLACSKTVPKRVCASKSMYYVVSRGTSMQSIGTKQPHKPIDHDKVLPACG